jgi:hypothetical protein
VKASTVARTVLFVVDALDKNRHSADARQALSRPLSHDGDAVNQISGGDQDTIYVNRVFGCDVEIRMRHFTVDGEARNFHWAVTVFPWSSALARYLSAADKFNRLCFAGGRQHLIANPKLFNVGFALGGLYSRPWEETATTNRSRTRLSGRRMSTISLCRSTPKLPPAKSRA